MNDKKPHFWTLFFNRREVRNDETQTDESSQRSPSTGPLRLEALNHGDAAMDETRDTLAEVRPQPAAKARVVLMPLKVARFVETVRYLAQLGYRMKVIGRHVEMVNK